MINIEPLAWNQMRVEDIVQNLVGYSCHNLPQCLLELKWLLFGFD